MRGQITSYDTASNTGVIKGDDANLYVFARHDIHTGSEIVEGQTVDFVPAGSTATQIVILSQEPVAPADAPAEPAAAFGAAAGSMFTAPPSHDTYDFKSALLSYFGRMRRQHFWISFLIIAGASILTSWIPFIGWLISLVLTYASVVITIKRLHDMGKSGWLALVPYVGAVIAAIIMIIGSGGAIMAAAAGGEPNGAALMGAAGAFIFGGLIMLVTNLGFLIWIGITDSQPGENQYGANPKGL